MKIKHRFGFNSDEKHIIRFLDKHNINYDKGEFVSICEMFEDDEKFDITIEFMRRNNELDIMEKVFSRNEVESAQWLTIKSSWWSQYPQPQEEKEYIFTTYDTANYCDGNKPEYYCEKGLVQKECFVIKREPRWGSRNFMMLNWVADELFVSPKAVNVLKESNLKGFELYDVFNKSKKNLEGVKQLFVNYYLPIGLCSASIERKCVCPKCSFVKYIPNMNTICFHNEIFDELKYDIVKTSDKFGEIDCNSLTLINHRFYEVIKKANLDRDLVFEPVQLI